MKELGFTRRDFIKLLGGTGTCLILPSQILGKTIAPKKPNFIFVFADDWGWGDLGCYGHPHLKTPNLDKLAKQGVLFTNFYVNSPVCAPSRAAIMTGHFPARHKIHHALWYDTESNESKGMVDYLDPKICTITKLLKKAGYTTAHYGKWHLGNTPEAPTPAEYGIDDHRIIVGNGKKWDWQNDPYWWSKSSGLFIDETINFIETNKNKPFFINTWLLDTHAVLNPTEEQMKPYEKFSPSRHAGKNHKGAMRVYYAAATNADKQIGRLLDKIDELGLSENTVVIFSSDNGPEDIQLTEASHSGVGSPGPFRGRKRSIYEGGIRTPFIVRWPAGCVNPGSVDDTTVISGVDFIPSICSLAGIKVPVDLKLDGEDMSEALCGKPQERQKPLMWEWRFHIVGHVMNHSPMLAIRDGKWKLLMNPDGSRIELYDLLASPMEVDNLADTNPEIVKTLSEKLLAWQATLPKGPIPSGGGENLSYPWPKK